MRQPKMGGKEKLRVFIKGNDDIADSLLAIQKGGSKLDRGLTNVVGDKYNGAFNVEMVQEPCGRSDLLIQQLETASFPRDLAEQGLDDDFINTQFQSHLFDDKGDVDVVVLSIQPECAHTLWKHRRDGYLLCPPPGWEEQWTPSQKEWFQEQFSSLGLLGVDQFKENFSRIIQDVKQRLDAHVIVYNGSSIDPDDHVQNYHGVEDTLALRVNKLNLALMQISTLEGVSIVDVDRIVAELGGAQHVGKAFDYSAESSQGICQEFVRVLEDIGFFEDRPLVMQIGRK